MSTEESLALGASGPLPVRPLRVPAVGLIVHYVSHGTPVREDGTQAFGSLCRAALITAVPEWLSTDPLDGAPNGTDGLWDADLAVLNPEGLFFARGLSYDPSGAPGTWHWLGRVH